MVLWVFNFQTTRFSETNNYNRQVLPHPPVLRGVETVVSTLKKNGHTVIPWTPHKHDFGHNLINNIYASDGNTVRKDT